MTRLDDERLAAELRDAATAAVAGVHAGPDFLDGVRARAGRRRRAVLPAAAAFVLVAGAGVATYAARSAAPGDGAARVTAVPSPPTGTATASADTHVVRGALATFWFRDRAKGGLHILAQHTRSADGTETVEVSYDRFLPCQGDTCPIAWNDRRFVPLTALWLAPKGTHAQLRDVVAGEELHAVWETYGAPSRQVDENGALSLERYNAHLTVRWGDETYVEPHGEPTPASLFTRITEARRGDDLPATSPAADPAPARSGPAPDWWATTAPLPEHGSASTGAGTMLATLAGDAATGCVWLVAMDGSRYAALWPAGYRASFAPLRVHDADGRVAWRADEPREVMGYFSDVHVDRVPEACRIGPAAWWIGPLG